MILELTQHTRFKSNNFNDFFFCFVLDMTYLNQLCTRLHQHSLSAWQPVLSLPLKEAMVVPEGAVQRIAPKIGVNAIEVVSNIHTITEFDNDFITPLHGCVLFYAYISLLILFNIKISKYS